MRSENAFDVIVQLSAISLIIFLWFLIPMLFLDAGSTTSSKCYSVLSYLFILVDIVIFFVLIFFLISFWPKTRYRIWKWTSNIQSKLIIILKAAIFLLLFTCTSILCLLDDDPHQTNDIISAACFLGLPTIVGIIICVEDWQSLRKNVSFHKSLAMTTGVALPPFTKHKNAWWLLVKVVLGVAALFEIWAPTVFVMVAELIGGKQPFELAIAYNISLVLVFAITVLYVIEWCLELRSSVSKVLIEYIVGAMIGLSLIVMEILFLSGYII